MEKAKILSKYLNNPIAEKKKIFLSNLFDYFITLVATFFTFYLGLIFTSNLPILNETVKKYQDTTKEVFSYINTTHLLRYNVDSGEQSSTDADANKYLKTLVKTSAYIYDLNYPLLQEDSTYDVNYKVKEEETFIKDHDEYKLDNISYFFIKFSSSNPELQQYEFDNVDYKDDLTTFIYLKVMGYEKVNGYEDIFVKEDNAEFSPFKAVLPRFLVLDKELTSSLINRLVYNDSTDAKAGEVANMIKNGYVNAIQKGINVIETYSTEYKGIMTELNKIYEKYGQITLVIFLVSYVVGYLIVFGLGRAMGGEFITVAQKTRGLGLSTKDDLNPGFWNIFVYQLVNFFMHLSSCVILFMFTGYMGILNVTIVGPINFFVIELVLAIFVMTSIVMTFFTKDGQSAALFLSKMVLKDTKTYEEISLNEMASDKKEESNGDKQE